MNVGLAQGAELNQVQPQRTVVNCRILRFREVAGTVTMQAALDMIKQYVRVCSAVIKSYQGIGSGCTGVQIVSFWLEEDGYASFKELACHAELKQGQEVQPELFSTWLRYLAYTVR